MRILVMANGNSIFTCQYIERMHAENYEIVCVDFSSHIDRQEYYEYYKSIGVVFLWYPRGINVSLGGLMTALKIKERGNFDVCHVMYPMADECHLLQMCRENVKQIIVNFWGSDFYRATLRVQSIQKRLLDIADVIILPTETMERPFVERWPDLKARLAVVEFEAPIYLRLKEENSHSEEFKCKDREGSNNRIVVVAGHSGDPNDQQEMIISAISKCGTSMMSKIIVVFPMTYGLTKEYENKIRKSLQDAPFESVILTEYLSEDEVCMLRRKTDVFIQAITTDAFSGAMAENLYSQSVILCGDWLNYPQLRGENSSIVWYSDEEDLSKKFASVINYIDIYKKEAVKNQICIENIKAKRKNVMNWNAFYGNACIINDEKSGLGIATEEIEAWMEAVAQIQKADLRKGIYNDVMNQWLKKQICGESPICNYIEGNQYKNVLIYGAGILGELVYTEVKEKCEITICDQNSNKRTWYDGTIGCPERLENRFFDCIIITPVHIVEEVKAVLDQNKICGNEVVSVTEIVGR